MPYYVLIVDNQRGVSRLLRSALETIEQGLSVSEVQSGEEAILAARHARTDLLITDYRLPGLSGLELMRKFRVVNPDCKVILISDIVDNTLRNLVVGARPDAFFQKPVPLGDFLDAVERCLGLARTIRQPAQTSQPPAEAPQPSSSGLSSVLASLRKNVGAQAVLLLNNEGEIKAEAGQIPDNVRHTSLAQALVGLRIAGTKAAGLIDHSESYLHLFKGDNFDAIFVPAGSTHSLLLVGNGLAEIRALSSRLKLISSARVNLLEALKNLGVSPEQAPVSTQVPAVKEPVTHPEDLPGDFLKIFNQLGNKTADVNSFWDTAVQEGTTFLEPDKLTYEQASRLGLTPDSSQEK